ncbi:vesicle-associated protein 1-3-like [Rosa sericea]
MLLTQVQEILLEYSFCTVTVQAQKEAAPDMQCKDKFLLQRVKTNDGATIKKITLEVVLALHNVVDTDVLQKDFWSSLKLWRDLQRSDIWYFEQ